MEEERASILVVDDQAVNLVAFEAVLAPLGQRVVTVDSGEGALKELLEGDFAVILMDVRMPSMDGLETAQIIKARERTRHIPIIFLTAANDDPARTVRGYAHGAVDFLIKPCDPEILRSKVAVFVELYLHRKRFESQESRLRTLERERVELEHGKRWRFLADASRVLASTLDYEETLSAVADLAVPLLCDGCAVHIEQDGVLELLAVSHRDTALADLARALGAQPFEPDATSSGPASVLRTHTAEIITHVTEPVATTLPSGSAGNDVFSVLGARSWVCVPLIARDQTVGTISFVISDPKRAPLGENALPLIEELAARAALAIDNARLYHEAQDAVRIRDEFLSIASHELKTPITSVKLRLQQILREARRAGPTPRLVTDLERSNRGLDRLTKLIEELLDLSRIASQRLELELEEVDLAEVVREVVERFDDEIARTESKVTVQAEPLLGRWDRPRLDQVISNLLSNALKYGDGKPIEIAVHGEGDVAWLTVRDRGIGISPADQKRIFERFERAVSVRHFGGFGLGLWIVRQIVEGMGGSVRLASSPDEGTTFTVELPRQPALANKVDSARKLASAPRVEA